VEGHVIGTWYEEIEVGRLFGGTPQLNKALRPLNALQIQRNNDTLLFEL
jgi:hypothetical protein